ncbi:arsenosugar biosynthesis radical SAM (seleno)protein ArsS [Gilvimarinus sp. F26214L]|uniref:arsenosugar biosynthesis radical SAM (seleno)protein ArsS n=1 Tax=Gilvimarinus sp. DZF01 TaxID=3461371 RepID=UPI00404681D1
MLDTKPLLRGTDFPAVKRGALETLQVNMGYLCNQSCTHCHVNAGPRRTELMSGETVDQVLALLETSGIRQLDLTGGAPEMNPHFRHLVREARRLGVQVVDRCNLTILLEPGYEDLGEFLADQRVHVTASLPCYSEKNVSEQRGKGIFEQSIEALRRLNALGYGSDAELELVLVYNPNGAFLPPSQEQLQQDYKRELRDAYGIVFDRLLTITNMPISRFGGMLLAKGLYDDYLGLLKDNFSPANLRGLMCRSLISVDWQGAIYDCDFNQMLNWPAHADQAGVIASDRAALHVSDLLSGGQLHDNIVVGEHCYGCTAGQGSSCGGALS